MKTKTRLVNSRTGQTKKKISLGLVLGTNLKELRGDLRTLFYV